MITSARLRAALAIACAGLDVECKARPLVEMAWTFAQGDSEPGVDAAMRELEHLGPRAVRLLLDRIADELIAGRRLTPDSPAVAWLNDYTDRRACGDYRGCTEVVASAGAALEEWTRDALVVAAHSVRAAAR